MKKNKITVVLLLVLVIIVAGIFLIKGVSKKRNRTDIEIPTKKAELNQLIEQYGGTINGLELKYLIRRTNIYNTQNAFPNDIILELDGQELEKDNRDDYNLSSPSIISANYYDVMSLYDEKGYIYKVVISTNIDGAEHTELEEEVEIIEKEELTEPSKVIEVEEDDTLSGYDWVAETE